MNEWEIALTLTLVVLVAAYVILEDFRERRIEFKQITKRQNELEDKINEFLHTPKEDDNKNLMLIKQMAEHLDMKVIEKPSLGVFFDDEPTIHRRIEPKTDNEKRIDELHKEIEMLRELDKEQIND